MTYLSVGYHKILFKVKNDLGKWSDEDSIYITIHSRPVAFISSITPKPGFHDTGISFEGSGTDDGTIDQYSWMSDIDGELYNGSSETFVSDPLSLGVHTITLKVMDDFHVWSNEVTTTLIIHQRPSAQIFSILPNPAVDDDLLIIDSMAEDDGTIVLSNWRIVRNGEAYSEGPLAPTTLPNGTYRLYYKVQDNHGAWSDEDVYTILVHSRPVSSIDPTVPNQILLGESIHFTGSGADDGDVVRYEWSSSLDGELHNDTTVDFQTSDLSHGLHTITLRVQDDYSVWSNDTTTHIDVHTIPVADLVAINPNPALDKEILSFQISREDDGSFADERWIVKRSDSVIYNGSTPPSTMESGTYEVIYQAQDNHGYWSPEDSAELIVHEQPTASIHPTIPHEIEEGETIIFMGNGSDDGSITRYVWRSSKDGELYNGTSDEFSLSNLSKGEHVISLKVQDNYGAWSDDATIEVKVIDDLLLFREVGPFPIIAYILLLVIVVILGIGFVMKKKSSPPTHAISSQRTPSSTESSPPYTQDSPTPLFQTPPSPPSSPPPPSQNQLPHQYSQQPFTHVQPQVIQSNPIQPIPQQTISDQQQPIPGVSYSAGGLCTTCGSQNTPDYKYCMTCGNKLG